jgi:nitrile hydratase
MDSTRRDFLAGAVVAGATVASHDPAHAAEHVHQQVPSDTVLRVKSLESLLVEKGLVDRAAIDAIVDVYENKVGPRNGARVVARAWTDPALANGTATDRGSREETGWSATRDSR